MWFVSKLNPILSPSISDLRWVVWILWLLNPINFYAHRFQTSCDLSQSCDCWTPFMPTDFRLRVSFLNPMYVEPHPMLFDLRPQVSCLNPMIAEPHSMPIDLGHNAAVLSGWLYMVCFSNYIQLYQMDVYILIWNVLVTTYSCTKWMSIIIWHVLVTTYSCTKWMTLYDMFQWLYAAAPRGWLYLSRLSNYQVDDDIWHVSVTTFSVSTYIYTKCMTISGMFQ